MIRQSFKMAWKSISSNKMRSLLTMLGIIIGVVALVVLVSLVSGTTDSVTSSINSLGSNMLTVSVSDNKGNPIKLDQLSEFAEDEEIDQVAPTAQSSFTAASTYSEETAVVFGTTGPYADINGLTVAEGRFIKNADVENHTNVVVISSDMAVDIMGRKNVTGETIKINGLKFQIIGVLEADSSAGSSTSSESSQDYRAYIPYTAFIRMSDSATTEITSFCVSATSEESLEGAETALTNQLLKRFNSDEDAFTVTNQSSVMEAMQSVTNTLALLLGGIAGISLLVGGIGIMNIMLVSVTERTREIGIRKAIGASHGTILLQFLIEAFVVSILGCVIGIILSWVTLQIVNIVGGESAGYTLSVGVVWVAIGFSTAIGIIFGIYPANKAASKKPIDALRYTG